ncbi:MAG: methionine synthase [Anaerolineae bacterium]
MVQHGQHNPNCRATGVGSTPHTDSSTAVDFVLKTFPDVPFWPQLPRRVFQENMYTQFTEHLPGVRLETKDERIFVQLGEGWLEQAEIFYAAFLEQDPARFATSPEYAAGLHELLRRGPLEEVWAVKGQVTGPTSFGLQVTDQDLRPTLYDEMMRDTIIKNVLRQAQWQEAQLRTLCPRTIISIDEPFLSVFGSAFASISREEVTTSLEEIFSGLEGWTCTHCCANTDWSLLLETSVDILAFDACGYAEYLTLYPDELRGFLARGGMLAWGLVPNIGEEAENITLDKAWEVLERALVLFERKGFDRRKLLPRSFITPACGTGTLSVPVAERVMRLTRELSDQVQEEYGLADN